MMVREALNTALDEEMGADRNVFLMGEEVMYCCSNFSYPQYIFCSTIYVLIFFCDTRLGNIRVHTRSPSPPQSLSKFQCTGT